MHYAAKHRPSGRCLQIARSIRIIIKSPSARERDRVTKFDLSYSGGQVVLIRARAEEASCVFPQFIERFKTDKPTEKVKITKEVRLQRRQLEIEKRQFLLTISKAKLELLAK